MGVSLDPCSGINTSTGIISSDILAVLQMKYTVAHSHFTADHCTPTVFLLSFLLSQSPQVSTLLFHVKEKCCVFFFFILLEFHFSLKSQISYFFLHINNPTLLTMPSNFCYMTHSYVKVVSGNMKPECPQINSCKALLPTSFQPNTSLFLSYLC